MSKPRLLDLFCGAGGCTKGYQEAGFYVVGVDIAPQPNYCGDQFIQADALELMASLAEDGALFCGPGMTILTFDAIHASPPCQAHTSMRHFGKGAGEGAPELIAPTRGLLQAAGLPYVIENVVGAPLTDAIRLCGSSFGLNVWRHRLFETNWHVVAPPECRHDFCPEPIAVYGDHPQTSKERNRYRVRRARTLAEGQEAMGIDWMPWKELTQAIPPAYTRFIGEQLLAHLATQPKEVERSAA